jgi:predicted secreted protein
MRNYKGLLLLLFVAALFAIVSCKKDTTSANIINLTAADAGKTVAVSSGQTVSLTLGNPGDGGYVFDAPQCDTTVLHLNKHTFTPPANSLLVGAAGSDTFEFMPLKKGISTLAITASRGVAIAIPIFSCTINVQ